MPLHCLYSDEEKTFMKPLPLTPYEPAFWSTAKVPLDYLITDGKNKYSVPFNLIGEKVDIRLTKASIYRWGTGNTSPTMQMSSSAGHRQWGCVHNMSFERFLSSGREPEQGYKSCASLTKLVDRYGLERLEHACDRVLIFRTVLSVCTEYQHHPEKRSG